MTAHAAVGSPRVLLRGWVPRIHDAVIAAGLSNARDTLLSGIERRFVASLPVRSAPSEQILSDLYRLCDQGRLPDGTIPMGTWLVNAAQLAAGREEAALFDEARDQLHSRSAGAAAEPMPAYADLETRLLAERLDAARRCREALDRERCDTSSVRAEILELRRRLREGGTLRAGDSLGEGRYLLLDQIGRGGFASVWRAHDRTTGAAVAVKVLHPDLTRDATRRDRFFRGARIMASLRHEAVVRVLDPRGEDGGYDYFVMELVEGRDLRDAVLQKALSGATAMAVIVTVARALAEAHEKGIVHRDVKPANILLDRGHAPKITDFDLVAAADTTGGTRTGALGTFMYAAPELLDQPQAATAAADVFGLGMTAVFCLHGKDLPKEWFQRSRELVMKLDGDPALKKVLQRAVAWRREDRFPNAGEFCRALEEVTALPPASDGTGSAFALGSTRGRKEGGGRGWAAVVVLSAAGLVGVGALTMSEMLAPSPSVASSAGKTPPEPSPGGGVSRGKPKAAVSAPASVPSSASEKRALALIRELMSEHGMRPAPGRDVHVAESVLTLDVPVEGHRYGIAYLSRADQAKLQGNERSVRGGPGREPIFSDADDREVEYLLLYEGDYMCKGSAPCPCKTHRPGEDCDKLLADKVRSFLEYAASRKLK